jgi:hypothetical protein
MIRIRLKDWSSAKDFSVRANSIAEPIQSIGFAPPSMAKILSASRGVGRLRS